MIRITGIVKTANQVRSKLQQGVNSQEIDSLKVFVENSLQKIENICQTANYSPYHLPTRSRKAYHYLKTLDWHNLPLTNYQSESPAKISNPTLRIKNVVKQQKHIQQQIAQLKPNYTISQLEFICQALKNSIKEIDRICKQNKITPAALITPSRKAYAWMKLIGNQNNLKLHINTVQRIKAIFNQAIKTQQLNIEEVNVEITNYNGLYKYKKNRQGNIELQLSEGFIQADDDILQAIALLVLLGNNAREQELIRNFSLSEEYSDVVLELDLIADLDAETPQGNCYNLEELFVRINQEYFAGKMVKPRLTWNKILTHRKLGHYEPLRDRVVMSCTLDDFNVPQRVVELVLYHELLHKHHGVKLVNGKRMVHTPEFRRSERKFQYYQEAQRWLEKLSVLAM
jgi:hypothetical protein